MTIEQLTRKLAELENHPILMLSNGEIEKNSESKELKISVLTRLMAIKHILNRKVRNEERK